VLGNSPLAGIFKGHGSDRIAEVDLLGLFVN
jgi:hypothetical protein